MAPTLPSPMSGLTPSGHAAAWSGASAGVMGPWLRPPVDIIEDETGIVVIADIPGVPAQRMALRTEADQLVIEGELAPTTGEATASELPIGRYRRSFALSRELDPQGITALMDQGVLRIHIPRAGGSHIRRIPILEG